MVVQVAWTGKPLVSVWLSHPSQVLTAVEEVREEIRGLKRQLFPATMLGQSQVRGSDQAVYHSSSLVAPSVKCGGPDHRVRSSLQAVLRLTVH